MRFSNLEFLSKVYHLCTGKRYMLASSDSSKKENCCFKQRKMICVQHVGALDMSNVEEMLSMPNLFLQVENPASTPPADVNVRGQKYKNNGECI